MQVLKQECLFNKFDVLAKTPSRSTLLRRVMDTCPTPPPHQEIVALESTSNTASANPLDYHRGLRDSTFLYRFDFLPQLIDLLQDVSIFSSVNNLDVNTGSASPDRFGMFRRSDDNVLEVNSGAWYRSAYSRLSTDPNNQFLLPLMFYVDKTGTDMLQRHILEPLTFTTSIITYSRRQSNRAWRVLGFLPDLIFRPKSSSQQPIVWP
jgi:hypothetical protein